MIGRRALLAGAAALPAVASASAVAPAGEHFTGDHPDAPFLDVYLNGRPFHMAVEAHTGEGWVKMWRREHGNKLAVDERGELILDKVVGEVRVERRRRELPFMETGKHLDDWGEVYDLPRGDGEGDDSFRRRLLEHLRYRSTYTVE